MLDQMIELWIKKVEIESETAEIFLMNRKICYKSMINGKQIIWRQKITIL